MALKVTLLRSIPRNLLALLIFLGVSLPLRVACAADPIIINGGFELPVLPEIASGSTSVVLRAGSAELSGWSIDAGSVKVFRIVNWPYYPYSLPGHLQVLDLDGYPLQLPNGTWDWSVVQGTISQTISTTPGTRYEISFGFFPDNESARISVPELFVRWNGTLNYDVSICTACGSGDAVTYKNIWTGDIESRAPYPTNFLTGKIVVQGTGSDQLSFSELRGRDGGMLIDDVTIRSVPADTPLTVPPLQLPTAELTAPSNGATFYSTEQITLSATATDDGTIKKVEFLANGNVIGTATTTPYTLSTSLPAGSYTISAKATDNSGLSTNSGNITITVSNPPNSPPLVSISTPSDGATFLSSDNFPITANATDDGNIVSLEFFANDLRIGTDTDAPYAISIVPKALPPGNYLLTAKATDDWGVATTSDAVHISVASAGELTTIFNGGFELPVLTQITSGATSNLFRAGSAELAGWSIDAGSVRIFRIVNWPYYPRSLPGHLQVLDLDGYPIQLPNGTWDWSVVQGTISQSIPTTPGTRYEISFGFFPDRDSARISVPELLVRWNGTLNYDVSICTACGSGDAVTYKNIWTGDIESRAPYPTNFVTGKIVVEGTGNDRLSFSELRGRDGGMMIDDITIRPVPADTPLTVPPLQPPTAQLTAPPDAATFYSTDQITFSANAADDGKINTLQFLANGNVIGTATAAPYTVSLSLAAGTYTISARATDNSGLSATSPAVSITVSDPPNTPPLITTTGPASGATFLTSDLIAVTADASDDGQIVSVQFFANGLQIGTDTAPPYGITIAANTLSAGNYLLTAKATDDWGVTSTSPPVQLNLVQGGAPPVIQNGGFELPVLTQISSGATSNLFRAGSAELQGWSIDAGSVRVYRIVNWPYYPHSLPGHVQVLDLDGYPLQLPNGTWDWSFAQGAISQSISTTPGTRYEISFGFFPDSESARISIPELLVRWNGTLNYDVSICTSCGSGDAVNYKNIWTGDVESRSPYPTNFLTGKIVVEGTGYDLLSFSELRGRDGGIMIDDVTIRSVPAGTPLTVPPLQSPTATLTAPANGATFYSTDKITFSATATDDGTIKTVEFLANGNVIGSATTAPYTIETQLPPGTYVIASRATDNTGLSTTSASVTIVVNAPPNNVPIVTLDAPLDGATFSIGDIIPLGASATDDGAVAKVEFFANGNIVGTDLDAPYSILIPPNSLVPGTYTISACVTDNTGLTSTSNSRVITLLAQTNARPQVVLTAPLDKATFSSTQAVTLSAIATDDTGISKVEFYGNGTLLLTSSNAPYGGSILLPAGLIQVFAKAIDLNGATATSTPATITIEAPPDTRPTITLSSPQAGATLGAPGNVLLVAIVDGTTERVDFFQGGSLISSTNHSPFQFTVTGLAAGYYLFSAMAADNRGNTTYSANVEVRVIAPPRLSATVGTSGRFALVVTGTPGVTNRLESSSDLQKWNAVFTFKLSGESTTLDDSFSQRKLFYRIVTP